jgi:WD40 repeat protein
MAFNPLGRHFASTGQTGVVQLWDLNDPQKPIGSLRSESGRVGCLAFSPDGKTLAAGTQNGDIIVWDSMAAQKPSFVLRGHHGPVRGVQFGGDNAVLISWADNGAVFLWDLTNPLVLDDDMQTWISHAERIANRRLTEAERERFSIAP